MFAPPLVLFVLAFASPGPSGALPAPEVIFQDGHGQTGMLAFTADGRYLASAGDDPSVRLWDVSSGLLVRKFSEHADSVNGIAFSPDDQRLATAGADRHVRVFEVSTGRKLIEIRSTDTLNVVAFSPDGRLLASGGYDNCVTLHDAADGGFVAKLEHNGPITDLLFAEDGRLIAAFIYKYREKKTDIHIWEIANRKKIRTATLDGRATAAFTSNSSRLAISTDLDQTRTLDIASGVLSLEKGRELAPNQRERPGAGAVTRDGRLRARTVDSTFEIVDVARGAVLRRFPEGRPRVDMIQASARGPRIVAAPGPLRIWDLASGTAPSPLPPEYLFPQRAWCADESLLAGVYGADLLIVDSQGRTIHRFPQLVKSTYAIAFDESCKKLVFSSDAGLQIIDVEQGKIQRTFPVREPLGAIRVSPDGRFIGGTAASGQVVLQDAASGREIERYLPFSSAFAFRPDGKAIAVATVDALSIRSLDGSSSSMTTTLRSSGVGLLAIKALDFSPSGKLLASIDRDGGTAMIYDVATKKPWPNGPTGGGYSAIEFGFDERHLYLGHLDGTIRIFDLTLRREVAALASVGREDHAIVIPSGEYLVSPGAYRAFAFRLGGRVVPFDQFDLAFNRPDRVLQHLGYASPASIASYEKRFEKRLERMGIQGKQLTSALELPELSILSGPLPLTTREKKIRLRVMAKSASLPITRLQIYVNGVPELGRRGLDVARQKAKQLETEVQVELSTGRNVIQVSAVNAAGTESLRETLTTSYVGPSKAPKLYVVAIGVSDYQDNAYDLTYAAKDAGDLVQLLEQQKSNFSEIEVELLLDKNATRAKIVGAKKMLASSGVDDQVIMFLAGHGLVDDKLEYYFATADMSFDKPAARGVPFRDLDELLDGIPARKKILFMDTCQSGELDPDEKPPELAASVPGAQIKRRAVGKRGLKKVKAAAGAQQPAVENGEPRSLLSSFFADLRRGSGAIVIASAGGAEFALESSTWKNGVFTYALLEGMKSDRGDKNYDGLLSASELRDHVTSEVRRLTSGEQTPAARQDNLEFDFDIFSRASSKALVDAIKRGHQSAVDELLKDGANPNLKNGSTSPLEQAAQLDDLAMMQTLIDAGADANDPAALSMAAFMGKLGHVRLLVSNGARVDARVLHSTAGSYYPAAEVIRFLVANGASPTEKNYDGHDAAWFAVGGLQTPAENLRAVVESGAKLTGVDETGKNLVAVAAAGGRSDLIGYLVEKGVSVDQPDSAGNTPLLLVASVLRRPDSDGPTHPDPVGCVKVLAQKGANLNAKNKNGQTALAIALSASNHEVVQALRALGAR
jgi:WD40 repeat protein/ankyrin repeat protein